MNLPCKNCITLAMCKSQVKGITQMMVLLPWKCADIKKLYKESVDNNLQPVFMCKMMEFYDIVKTDKKLYGFYRMQSESRLKNVRDTM